MSSCQSRDSALSLQKSKEFLENIKGTLLDPFFYYPVWSKGEHMAEIIDNWILSDFESCDTGTENPESVYVNGVIFLA